MKVERPPELWEAQTDLAVVPLLGEMIAACLRRETLDLSELTLNASNVEVPEDDEPGGPPAGQFVALTVSGPAVPSLDKLRERLLAAGVRYAYIRDMGTRGSVTVFLARLA